MYRQHVARAICDSEFHLFSLLHHGLGNPLGRIARHLARAELGGLALAVALVAALVGLALGLGEAVVGVGSLGTCRVSSNPRSRLSRMSTYLVAKVGVDAHELATVDGRNALHVDGAGAVVPAVAAGAVDLSIVVRVEVDHVHVTAAVMLDAADAQESVITLCGRFRRYLWWLLHSLKEE